MNINGIFRKRGKPDKQAGASAFLSDVPKFIDCKKLDSMAFDISAGIRNYLLFQRFPAYRWPYWVNRLSDGASKAGSGIHPPQLINHSNRDWMYFTNLLSSEALRIDPSGMLSPTYGTWSVETWLLLAGRPFRAQESSSVLLQERDPLTSVIKTTWKEKEFSLVQTVFGARTSVDEAIVALECSLPKKAEGAMLLLVFRPYDPVSLGGMSEVEFKKDARIVKIDGLERAVLDTKPDRVLVGNGPGSDIDPEDTGRGTFKSSCKFGMATMALGYALDKGTRRIHLRLGLSRRNAIASSRLSYTSAAEEYAEFAGIRIKSGATLTFPDEAVLGWFYAAKLSLLNAVNSVMGKSLPRSIKAPDMKRYCLMVWALNRMGYHSESESMLRELMPLLGPAAEKSFENTMLTAYFISAFADYFIHSRDMEFLQSGYAALKSDASDLYKYSVSIKKPFSGAGENSLDFSLSASPHLYDTILTCNALRRYSYLARCMGLFGDENRYLKEATRLGGMIAAEIRNSFGVEGEEEEPKTPSPQLLDAGAVGYLAAACYPFRVEELGQEDLWALMSGVVGLYGGVPLYAQTLGGWDSVLSLLSASGLIQCRDTRYHDLIREFMTKAGGRFSVQDVLHPGSGTGMLGDGDSVEAMSAFALALRNMLFMDFENRLDLFPTPHVDWFAPGSEIVVREAPSRFGSISFRVISSNSEVQFRFMDLPKFVPPEIMINLPFKAKIKQESDFVIKKDFGKSITINGWPAIVKFSR